MAIDNLVGIIGWPVSHSVSPAMQNRAFLETSLDSWCYVSMPVPKYPYIRVKEAILGLRALGFKGANVTVPHKEAVLPYLEQLSETAKAIGAVNTIAVEKDGRLVGHNTDGLGFVRDLQDHKIKLNNLRVLLLGAGGSARAITYAMLQANCMNIVILNRTKTKADDLAGSFRDLFPLAKIKTGGLSKESLQDNMNADLIINSTSIGFGETKDQMPWDEDIHFSSNQTVYDLIYNPSRTTFLKCAEKDGAKVINGIGMLVHQGALAFEIWTGQRAPLLAMKEAALSSLKLY